MPFFAKAWSFWISSLVQACLWRSKRSLMGRAEQIVCSLHRNFGLSPSRTARREQGAARNLEPRAVDMAHRQMLPVGEIEHPHIHAHPVRRGGQRGPVGRAAAGGA